MYFTTFDPFARAFQRLAMPLDAVRHENDVTLRLDVPGIDPEQLEVTVDRGILTISGKRQEEGNAMAPSPFDDENAPLFTVGQVAEMLAVKQAFLRRVDELQVVSPQRSPGGQRRYTRYEIRVIQQVVSMADEGITLQAIRRIIELERELAELRRERDELARRLAELL